MHDTFAIKVFFDKTFASYYVQMPFTKYYNNTLYIVILESWSKYKTKILFRPNKYLLTIYYTEYDI